MDIPVEMCELRRRTPWRNLKVIAMLIFMSRIKYLEQLRTFFSTYQHHLTVCTTDPRLHSNQAAQHKLIFCHFCKLFAYHTAPLVKTTDLQSGVFHRYMMPKNPNRMMSWRIGFNGWPPVWEKIEIVMMACALQYSLQQKKHQRPSDTANWATQTFRTLITCTQPSKGTWQDSSL